MTLEKPTELSEETVQFFLRNYSVSKVNEMIEKCKKPYTYLKIVKEWEYIKWRIQQKQNVFIFR